MNNILGEMFKDDIRAYNDVEYFVENKLDIDWLFPMQKEILIKFYNPEKQYKELIVVAGMRSGKTVTASVAAAYEAYKLITLGNPCKHYGLPKGQEIFIPIIARSEDQAIHTVFSQFKARIDNSPWFQDVDMKEHRKDFEFPVKDAKIYVRAEHSNSSSLAGKTSKCVIFDEIARFTDTGGRSSGNMVYTTLQRQIKTFGPHGRLISISSPIFADDFQMQLYRRAADHSETMLRFHLATWQMNPTITQDDLAEDFEADPESAWRDFGAQPSASLEAYMKEPWRIKKVMEDDNINLVDEAGFLRKGIKPVPGITYFMAGDPAFKNDAFGLSMIHRDPDDNKIVVDLLHRFVPEIREDRREIDAHEVRNFILEIADRFPIMFRTDTWNFPETIQSLENAGVRVEQNHVKKKEYDYLKELIYTDRIKLPVYPHLIDELKALQLTRGVRIDHPRGGSKDVSDALANACSYESENTQYSEVPIAIGVDW